MNMTDITTQQGAEWLIMLAKAKLRYANKGYGTRSEAMTMLNRGRARLRQIVTGARPAEHYEDIDYETTIAGIPAGIVITHFVKGDPGKTWGLPENCYQPEDDEVEFVVVDRKGYEADWLRAKVSEAKLENHVMDLVRGRPVRVGVY